jgi:RNA polymerase sigma factor (sigma-70 family)
MSDLGLWRGSTDKVNTNESHRLLAEYVTANSEAAFRELVERYLGLVYATAVRLTGGDAHAAEDVAQTVFIHLARSARQLPADVMLGGWLHRDTCNVTAKLLRGERRRQARERQALQMNGPDHTEANLAQVAPILDEAINELGADDRTAILLRFFERQDFRAIGEALGSNEDAAQKRVSRALEKLHRSLTRRGLAFSVTTLAALLSAETLSAAPAGMAGSISVQAMTSAAAAQGFIAMLKAVSMTRVVMGLCGLAGAAAIALVAIHWRQDPRPAVSFQVAIGGTAGVNFAGTMVLDGRSTNVTGIVPATYQVNGRNVKFSFKKTQAEGQLSLQVTEGGKALGNCYTAVAFAGVLSEIRDYGGVYHQQMFTTF